MNRIGTFRKQYPYVYYAVILTPIPMIIAGLAAGGGHGTYLLMKLFYPYMMLSTFIFDEIVPSIFLASLAQYILYAVFITFADRRKMAMYVVGVIHVISFLLCLLVPSFSSKPYYF